jgi:hypothetical protein
MFNKKTLKKIINIQMIKINNKFKFKIYLILKYNKNTKY